MSLAGKLQLRPGVSVAVVGKPPGLELDLPTGTTDQPDDTQAALFFCSDRAELEHRRDQLAAAAKDDRLVWIAYPKAGQLGTDLNRDSLRELLAGEGVRPVRQIAIDDTWSALRLRPV
jgi:hypothetical protein